MTMYAYLIIAIKHLLTTFVLSTPEKVRRLSHQIPAYGRR